MKICVFPGTFDPFTLGHLDIVERAAKIFDRVVVGVNVSGSKNSVLSTADRLSLAHKCVRHIPGAEVKPLQGLLVDFCAAQGAEIIVRGIRSFNDFQYENMMSYVNKKLSDKIETLFMITNQANSHISSSTVRELIQLKADITSFVPEAIRDDLINLYRK